MQQQVARDAEHRRRRADPERQCDHGDSRPPLLPFQRSQRERQVLSQVVDELDSSHGALPVLRGLQQARARIAQRSEPAHCLRVGVSRCFPLGEQLFRSQREMQLDLVLDVALPPVAAAQRE